MVIRPAKTAATPSKYRDWTGENRAEPDGIQLCRGWVNYFKLADARTHLEQLDGWVRSRLRYCIWTQWKRVRTRYKALRTLGASHRNAYMWANTRKGGWHIAHSYVLKGTISNARLQKKGYIPLLELYEDTS